MEYLDFELEIGPGQGREYPLAVVRSPAGEARGTMRFPYDELALQNRLKDLQIVLLRSGGALRKVLSPEEQAVQDFGRDLFDALLSGEIRSRYDVSLQEAKRQGKGLRLKLRIQPPELAALPWEFLYDPRQAEYLCLSRHTPIVRYLELPQPIQPLTVTPPLRILGMVASPRDLPPLDVGREKQRVEEALKDLRAKGMVDLTWLDGQTWRDLQRALRGGPWHIFHFIGHGDFDRSRDEGFIALADEQGYSHHFYATELARLLANHFPLRLVLLNSCKGALGSERDIFSSTASILVRRGIPAVLAMQYEITDRAAIEFARAFYEALADGLPVDAAVVEARIAVSLGVTNTVEWGTPVLYMRSPDGGLFQMQAATEHVARAQQEAEKRVRQKAKKVAVPEVVQVIPSVVSKPIGINARKWCELLPLPGRRLLSSLAFSPDTRFLSANSAHSIIKGTEITEVEEEVCLWDMQTQKLVWTTRAHKLRLAAGSTIVFSPVNDHLLVSGKHVYAQIATHGYVDVRPVFLILHVSDGRRLREIEVARSGEIRDMAFLPNGSFLVLAGYTGGLLQGPEEPMLYYYSVKDYKRIQDLKPQRWHSNRIESIAISPDGRWLATGGGISLSSPPDEDGYFYTDPRIFLWDLQTGKVIRRLLGHTGAIQSLAFSLDSTLLVSVGRTAPPYTIKDDSVRVWNIPTGEPVQVVQAKKPRDCAFLPDSRHVVFATANIVRIINVLDGKDVLTLEHPGEIWALALAPDGITLAISVKLSQEETDSVWIWRLEGI